MDGTTESAPAGPASMSGKRPPFVLWTQTVVSTMLLSVVAFFKAATHPYVLDKLKKCTWPILILCAIVWVVGLFIRIPFRAIGLLVEFLTLKQIAAVHVSTAAHQLVTQALVFVPMISMTLMRSVIQKPLYKCFIHLLQEINPPLAAKLDTSPKLAKVGARAATSSPDVQATREAKPATSRRRYRVMNLLLSSFVFYVWRRLPLVGRFATPVLHYWELQRVMSPKRAILVSAAALLGPLEPWVLRFVEVWRASRVLGAELLEYYITSEVPYKQRAKWWRRNEVLVVAFMAPLVLIIQVRFIGPIMFFPAFASTASLVDLLDRRAAVRAAAMPWAVEKPAAHADQPPEQPTKQS